MVLYDFVCPNNDELAYIKIAESFSYHRLFFSYDLSKELGNLKLSNSKVVYQSISDLIKKFNFLIEKLSLHTDIKLDFSFLINSELDAFFKKTKKDFFSILAGKILIRKVSIEDDIKTLIENSLCSIFHGLEFHSKIDYMHHRNSGFNQVIGRYFSDNRLFYGFDMGKLFRKGMSSSDKDLYQSGRVMGRITQNSVIAKKYNVPFIVMSFASSPLDMIFYNDMISFFELFNLSNSYFRNSFLKFEKQFLNFS